jgi:hypothetical protein
MTVKPDLTGALLSLTAAVAAGFLYVYLFNYQGTNKLKMLKNNKT